MTLEAFTAPYLLALGSGTGQRRTQPLAAKLNAPLGARVKELRYDG